MRKISCYFNRIALFSLAAFALSLTAHKPALAWNDLGHAAVGYIAEQNLTPQARQLVYDLIGFEPLSVAAVFPDHVRYDSRFEGYGAGFGSYHFITIPVGESFRSLKKRDSKDADIMIRTAPAQFFNASLNQAQKAIYLRYLVHLVGDVHQPLHVGNGLDLGGNLCLVKWRSPFTGRKQTENLHKVWDENVFQNIAYQYQRDSDVDTSKKRWFTHKTLVELIYLEAGVAHIVEKRVGDGLIEKQLAMNTTKNLRRYEEANEAIDPGLWYDESQALHPVAYPDKKAIEPKNRKYCKAMEGAEDKFRPLAVPTLERQYLKRAQATVKARILQAGYRLAGILNRVAKERGVKAIDPTLQQRRLNATKPVNSED